MKFSTLALFASTVVAFSDTATFYASAGLDPRNFNYVTAAGDLDSALSKFSSHFCSANSDEKMYIYRVNRLRRSKPKAVDGDTYIKHVQYQSGSAVDMSISDSCVVEYLNTKPSDLSALSGNVIVVDIEDNQEHSIDEFLGAKYVFVQGKPSFESQGETFKEYIKDKLSHGLDELSKRSSVGTDDVGDVEDYETTLQEVESDFRVAESMIAAQESDAMVTALSDDHKLGVSGSKKNGTHTKSNIFTNYQFFTPGVWSALIVSFFLVYVASTAVNWITSIELSYKSFTKQVEYEKKTE